MPTNIRLALWNALMKGDELEYDNTNDEHFMAIARLYYVVQKKYNGYDIQDTDFRILDEVKTALFSFDAHAEFVRDLRNYLFSSGDPVIPTTKPQKAVTTTFVFMAVKRVNMGNEYNPHYDQQKVEALLPYTLSFGWKDIVPHVLKGRVFETVLNEYIPVSRKNFDYFMTLFEKVGIEKILLDHDISPKVYDVLYPIYHQMKLCGVKMRDITNNLFDYTPREFDVYKTWYREYIIRKYKPRYNLIAWRLAARTAMKLGR
jgi:hypothetical protein